jgi:hypothetical protein
MDASDNFSSSTKCESLPPLCTSGLLQVHLNVEKFHSQPPLLYLPPTEPFQKAVPAAAGDCKPKLGRPLAQANSFQMRKVPQAIDFSAHDKTIVLKAMEKLKMIRATSYPAPHTFRGHTPDQMGVDLKSKKVYECGQNGCEKTFPSKSRLRRHQMIHSGKKPFKCLYSNCDKCFSRRDNMMQHYKSHLLHDHNILIKN